MESLDNTFDMFFSNVDYTLNRFTSNDLLVRYDKKDSNDVYELLGETQENNTLMVNVYTAFDDTGEVIIYPDTELGSDFDVKERDWYKNALETEGETVWTEPYVDESTGGMVVTASKAYYKGSTLVGVVGVDMKVDTIIEMVDELTIGKTGYG